MSFSVEIINELCSQEYEKSCCKKALLFGAFFSGALSESDERCVRLNLKTEQSAALLARILKKQFSAEPELSSRYLGGRKIFVLNVKSKTVSAYLERIDRLPQSESDELSALVGFRCKECVKAFLAGAFVASGNATDPEKRYSLEFVACNELRADRLGKILSEEGYIPKFVKRGDKIGVYHRGNETVADLLTYMGAKQASFAVINAYLTNELKNNENRATNCVLKNIERSVSSARRQVEAIELIISSGRFEGLDAELKYTAKLRLDYDSATLAELALLHEPSISKSGLNKRLDRLLRLAGEIKNEREEKGKG